MFCTGGMIQRSKGVACCDFLKIDDEINSWQILNLLGMRTGKVDFGECLTGDLTVSQQAHSNFDSSKYFNCSIWFYNKCQPSWVGAMPLNCKVGNSVE